MSVATEHLTTHDRELLEAAQAGDEDAFRSLVEPRRAELHAHCYRMLGSVHDAEDALQEVLLRAWRGLPRFEGRSSFRSWLYTHRHQHVPERDRKRPKRVLPIDYGPSADPHDSPGEPLVESVWMEPYPDETLGLEDGLAAPEATYEQRESVELAFVAALQHLPPNQRAALILREVLGFSAREVAEALETTPQSVNSALQRARQTVDDKLPEQSQQATLREIGDEQLSRAGRVLHRGAAAGRRRSMLAMLTEDAAWSMPPLPGWYRGAEAVATFLTEYPMRERWRHIPTRANGQLAVGCYMWDEERESYVAGVLDVLTLRGGRIAAGHRLPEPMGLRSASARSRDR